MKEFKVKVSYWFFAVVVILFFAPVVLGMWASEGEELKSNMPWFIGYLGVGIYTVGAFFRLRYLVDQGILIIKWWGFTITKVPVAEIKIIEASNILMAAPAPSFDRVLITYGKFNDLVLSPQNKVAFGEYLKSLNPKIELKL